MHAEDGESDGLRTGRAELADGQYVKIPAQAWHHALAHIDSAGPLIRCGPGLAKCTSAGPASLAADMAQFHHVDKCTIDTTPPAPVCRDARQPGIGRDTDVFGSPVQLDHQEVHLMKFDKYSTSVGQHRGTNWAMWELDVMIGRQVLYTSTLLCPSDTKITGSFSIT
ncbi:hypothetical protein N657DRAFT_51538 [Parathielavia appendiculata]|uniref:Uncharacterized protein n=1 Tax=Parathielavia appendiculata TaxID=2587402 RepID=A0AAN6UCI0_9PEZI|nr:hypothetical protein N657DRAFT_51538 [Parathielavia appendiculata]